MNKNNSYTIPCDIMIEKYILSYMLQGEKEAADAGFQIKNDDFYFPENKLLFHVICKLLFEKLPIDMYTIMSEYKKLGYDSEKSTYAIDIADFGGRDIDLEYYISSLKNISQRRELGNILEDCIQSSNKFTKSHDFLEDIRSKFHSLDFAPTPQKTDSFEEIKNSEDFENSKNFYESFKEKAEHYQKTGNYLFPGIRTGFSKLDFMINGLCKGRFYVLGAHTSVGKTAFALNIAQNVAAQKNNVLLFLLEMNQSDVVKRIISSLIGFSLGKIDKGIATPKEVEMVNLKSNEIGNLPITINDSALNKLADIRASIRRNKEINGLDLVIVDYLQLIQGDKSESRQLEIAHISRSLKLMALEFDVPIIALTQLNRKSLERQDITPRLSDVRESGAIEQDADCIIFLHRNDYNNFEPHTQLQDISSTDVIVAKNRQGTIGSFKLSFNKAICRFTQD